MTWKRVNLTLLTIYHDDIASKGPDDVCTYILDGLYENYSEPNSKELRFYCDNCPGVKNHTLLRMCMALVQTGKHKKFEELINLIPLKVTQIYPMTGTLENGNLKI